MMDWGDEVAAGKRGSHFCDIAYLGSEVAGHCIDGVGKVLPRTRDTGRNRLASELPVDADLTGTRHLRGKGEKLVEEDRWYQVQASWILRKMGVAWALILAI
jgi:hypothetical protein